MVGHGPPFPETESSPLSGGLPGLGGGEPRLLHYGPEGLGLRLNSGPSSPGRLSLGQDCSAGLEESVAREALCPGQHSRYRLFSPGHLKARR